MAITLQKGARISLSKEFPNLRQIHIGLGWDARVSDGADFDLDASVFLLNASAKVRGDYDIIFYNQLRSLDGAVEHTGDNRTGSGDGDDEVIMVDLGKIAPDITKLIFTVTIHEAEQRRQNFGQVANAYIRLLDAQSKQELLRYDLGEDYSTETALIFGEVYRYQSEWKFAAVGQGFSGGLLAMCHQYGVNVA